MRIPTRDWMHAPDLPCRLDPEAWFVPGGALHVRPVASTQEAWDEAKAFCRRCPVMHQCRRDTMGEEYGVWGGLDERQRYLVRRAMPKSAKGWPPERRLRLGAQVHALRPQGDVRSTWLPVQQVTGLPKALAVELRQEYLDWMESRKAGPMQAVRALPNGPVWPRRPSGRHAWAWIGGRSVAAWYVAHTPDERHVLVRLEAGGLATITWLSADRVRIHSPQPIQIREMKAAVNVHDHEQAA